MSEELPKDYFCPKCNAKATHDLVEHLKGDGMPSLYIVQIAMNILFEAECPVSLLNQISEWAKTYGQNINGITEEERDNLKLVKWNVWAEE